MIYINFEDERIPLKIEFLTDLLPAIKECYGKYPKYIFLDEMTKKIFKQGISL